eukprot:768717-Hanusia_phi.AAC.2
MQKLDGLGHPQMSGNTLDKKGSAQLRKPTMNAARVQLSKKGSDRARRRQEEASRVVESARHKLGSVDLAKFGLMEAGNGKEELHHRKGAATWVTEPEKGPW